MTGKTAARFQDEWLVRVVADLPGVGASAVEAARALGKPFLSHALIDDGTLSRERLAEAVQHSLRLQTVKPATDRIGKMALNLVTEKTCRRYHVVPLNLEGETLELAMANPLDLVAQSDIEALTGRTVLPRFALPNEISTCLDDIFSQDAVIFELLEKIGTDEEVEVLGDMPGGETGSEEVGSPVIQLVNSILAQAVHRKASDIHIEHEERSSHVRFRIDGELKNIMALPRHLGTGPMVSRIKIMSNLDPANHMRPQDGRTKIRLGAAEIGLRVSVLPTAYGEKVVMRLLDKRVAQVPFEKLGFAPETVRELERCLDATQGILLVTGPTGSGKTTTLYSVLNKRRGEATNIVTAEDPIEYKLEGINQVQVNEKQGLGFAMVLRSVLRQDPDVIMVGEIRDQETADIAFQAAMTGHLVFSTLHTNDTVSTISRLADMGVERFKIAPGLLAITAQRLVRRICVSCREPVPEEAMDRSVVRAMREYGLPVRSWKGAGCKDCDGSGYKGRVAIVELLVCDQPIKDLISSGAAEAVIRENAERSGSLRTLTRDALWQLSEATTDQSEVLPYLRIKDELAATAAAPAPAPTQASAPVAAGAAPQKPGGKPVVLVADDDPIMRLLARKALEGQGFEVREAADGEEALTRISEAAPDLLLLDLDMPKLTGFDVIKGVRQTLGLSGLPIIMITAQAEDLSQELALSLGADDYIIKPFKPALVTARIKAALRRAGRQI